MGCSGPHTLGGTPVGLYLYVEDVDHAFTRAVSAGAKADMPVADMFWGIGSDRSLTHSGISGTSQPIRKTLRLKRCGNEPRPSMLKRPPMPYRDL